ncbi:MAG: methyltransferase domain-containing protein [Clostridia bacterium]|nr:methyltransferase domain-containing protein [Clostridia bacterium]
MARISDARVVTDQYSRPDKLNTRISLHEKYSENPQSFGDWLLSCYRLPPCGRILELGCGTAAMWRGRLDLLEGRQMILSDLSEGMLDAARQNLSQQPNIDYRIIDIQAIPYPEASFDAVIANMMLYHVPDLHRGLGEVRRVLKPGGAFYCATFGERGHNWHIARMLASLGVRENVNASFTLQNGGEALAAHFDQVTRIDRQDALVVTDVRDLADYVLSCASMTGVEGISAEQLCAVFEARKRGGALRLPKEYGLFVCR